MAMRPHEDLFSSALDFSYFGFAEVTCTQKSSNIFGFSFVFFVTI